ncbi:hypothetical protein P7K49_002741, partial [Saguinus oedipus]
MPALPPSAPKPIPAQSRPLRALIPQSGETRCPPHPFYLPGAALVSCLHLLQALPWRLLSSSSSSSSPSVNPKPSQALWALLSSLRPFL